MNGYGSSGRDLAETPWRSCGRVQGFTLIELVTCIVIIGIIAAVSGPRFFNNEPFAERGYATEIASALRAARQIAVTSACEVRLTIDPVAGYQALQRAAAGNDCSAGGAWTTPVRLTDGALLAGVPSASATVTPATQIVFNSLGQTNGVPPPLTVGGFTVRVDSVSGLVSVQ